MKNGRRLAKLECAFPPIQTVERTQEEQRILVYEIVQALLRVGKFPSMQERLADYASRTASEICRKAAMPMTEIYRRHILYVEEMWVASGRKQLFVPPVLGSDYDEWFLPGLAERRLAVRRRPSVIALIGETTRSPWFASECPASESDDAQA